MADASVAGRRRRLLVGATFVLAATILMTEVPAWAAMTRTRSVAPHVRAPCAPVPLERVAAVHAAAQVLLVVAVRAADTFATVTRYAIEDGCLREVGPPSGGRIGVHGLSAHHREGDGTTPLGVYRIGATMYGIAPDPGVDYPYHRLVCGDWWDEDPSTPAYNLFVHVPCGERPPFRGGSEALWTEAPAYDAFAVIDYNPSPIHPGLGSAIFLHVAGSGPTDGCVAIAPVPLVTTLRWFRPTDNPVIDIEIGAPA